MLLPDIREASGVIVAAKVAGLGGQENSLAAGDIIHGLNGVPVVSVDFLRSKLGSMKPGTPVVLQIERDGVLMYVAFPID